MGKDEIAILLTATINPDGMAFTVLQDRDIREKQYRESLDYYLDNTDYKIVFCENSGIDISKEYKFHIDSGRIEFLVFSGNNYDKSLGKGYGEVKIILYALENSQILKSVEYLVKITGRLIIPNIKEIIKGLFIKNAIRCDFLGDKSIYSMIYVCPLSWITKISNYVNQINDTKGICMENVLYQMLCDNDPIIIPFFKTPIIKGINGSSGYTYESILPSNILERDLIYIGSLYKMKGHYIVALSIKIVGRLFCVIRKFLNIKRMMKQFLKRLVPLKYYRRKSQYTKTGQVALCCIAKMENDYIRFFVEYYRNLYFDKIYIYDNNNFDGERLEEVLSDYLDGGLVEIIDFRGKKLAQLAAYQECYDSYNKLYDWIAFFDCDEFLTFADDTKDIHTFLNQKKFLSFQSVHINWKIYGDNNLLDSDGDNVVNRFQEPVMPLDFVTRDVPFNSHVKSIVRGGLSDITWKSAHTPNSRYYLCCNSEGVEVDINSPYQEIEFKTVFLRHYRTKTIGEWVRNKMTRGFADMSDKKWKQILTINHFFEYNQITHEKLDYAYKVLEEIKATPLLS